MRGSAALALGAGLLAALNPCGFALLPAYLGLLINNGPSDPRAAVLRAVRATLAMTAGFVAVFAVFGVVVLPFSSAIEAYLPWVSIGLGLLLMLAATWLLAGRSLPAITLPGLRSPVVRTTWSMSLFGVAYALSSLSCTIAPFLVVVAVAINSGSIGAGVAGLGLYTAGMLLVVGSAAVAVALADASLIARLRRLARLAPRASALLLLVSGTYSVYYGIWELRVLAGRAADDRLVATAERVQSVLVSTVEAVWPVGVVVVFVGLLLLVVPSRRTLTHLPPSSSSPVRPAKDLHSEDGLR